MPVAWEYLQNSNQCFLANFKNKIPLTFVISITEVTIYRLSSGATGINWNFSPLHSAATFNALIRFETRTD